MSFARLFIWEFLNNFVFLLINLSNYLFHCAGHSHLPFIQECGWCKKCGSEKQFIDCFKCEDGYSHHDCGEDTCACLKPEPNVPCDLCDGQGTVYGCSEFTNPDISSSKERSDEK